PVSIGTYDSDQFIHRFRGWNVSFYYFFSTVQRNPVRSGPNVSVVGVSHLARAVDDTSHDTILDAFEMERACANFCGGLLEIEKCSATGWTGYIFGLRYARTCSLKNIEARLIHQLVAPTI